jgi:hypothetical protein
METIRSAVARIEIPIILAEMKRLLRKIESSTFVPSKDPTRCRSTATRDRREQLQRPPAFVCPAICTGTCVGPPAFTSSGTLALTLSIRHTFFARSSQK